MGLLDPHSSSTDIYAYRYRDEVARDEGHARPNQKYCAATHQMGLISEPDVDRLMGEAKDQLDRIEEIGDSLSRNQPPSACINISTVGQRTRGRSRYGDETDEYVAGDQ